MHSRRRQQPRPQPLFLPLAAIFFLMAVVILSSTPVGAFIPMRLPTSQMVSHLPSFSPSSSSKRSSLMPASPSFRPSPLEATFPDTDLVQSTTTSILSLLSSPPSVLLASQDGDWLETAGTYTLNWLKDVNYGAVFASSLFPYLWFLKNIWADDYPIPKTMKWGFASLLIFVISTIIGGIAAKIIYDELLANIDYIHGVAESLLGVTNIVLAIAAFRALEAAKKDRGGERPERWTEDRGVDV